MEINLYSCVNSEGATYYLWSNDTILKSTGRVQTIYFFSRDKSRDKGKRCDLPEGKVVCENPKTLLPFLKSAENVEVGDIIIDNINMSKEDTPKLDSEDLVLNEKEHSKKVNNENNLNVIEMNSIESDIYRAIDMAFGWFKNNNPTLEVICDEETMSQWYDFIKWCYAQDGEGNAEYELKNNPSFNFEISPLMENAMIECDGWWCKYNVDHQQIAEEEFKEDCGGCDGNGYTDEGYENECETCEGSGKDPEDEGGHWVAYEEAFDKISNSVDTSSFEKLSKIF